MIKVRCPHCRQELDVPESARGKKGRCTHCEEVFAIPADLGKSLPAKSRQRRKPKTEVLPAPRPRQVPAQHQQPVPQVIYVQQMPAQETAGSTAVKWTGTTLMMLTIIIILAPILLVALCVIGMLASGAGILAN